MGETSTKLVPVGDFKWTDDYSFMRELTCKNHPTAKYLSKNPWDRGLHVIAIPTDKDIPRTATGECTCPFGDLMVVVKDGEPCSPPSTS